jgi:serine/threonine protein kinase
MNVGDRIGAYEVCEHIASGGMAQVWKVRREVGRGGFHFEAMKVPHVHLIHDPLFVEMFLDEARKVVNLDHPHIVRVINWSDSGAPQPFFTMELVEGPDLADVLKDGRMELRRALKILSAVAAALDHAHHKGVIHRDVKPSNVLMAANGASGEDFPKVVDFGISKAAEEGGTRLTRTGMIVGSPPYMSPEQAGSGPPVDYRTDIYSFGIMAYEMLCGCPPFHQSEGTGPMSVLVKHIHEKPPAPHLFNNDLPRCAEEVLLRALDKNPDARPQSCAHFISDLEDALHVRILKDKPRFSPVLLLIPLALGATLIVAAVTGGSTLVVAPPEPTPQPTAFPTSQPTPGLKPTPTVSVVDATRERATSQARDAEKLINRAAANSLIVAEKRRDGALSDAGLEREIKKMTAQYHRALQLAQSAIEADDMNQKAWIQRCRAYYNLGQWEQAQQAVTQAKTRFPGSDELELLSARIKTARG